jgi:enoyl-CoA hydratase/carnithine racemase
VSGADISEFERRRTDPEAIAEYGRIGARANASYKALGKPIIAMVQGFCLGGGLLTALKADLRVAADTSQFGVPAVRLGVGYGYENVKAVSDVVGLAHARDILLTGRRFDAATALRMGLIHQVAPVAELEAAVRSLAATIAEHAPLTIRAIRAALDELAKPDSTRDLAAVDRLAAECMVSEDYKEGRRAFMEKRKPQFQGR